MARSVSKWNRTHALAYAARAILTLSLAFIVFLALCQSIVSAFLLYENRIPGRPQHRHTQGRQPR